MTKVLLYLIIAFCWYCPTRAQSDSLKYYGLLQLSDTLHFGRVHQGIFGEAGNSFRNRRVKVPRLNRRYTLLDSIPQYNTYLYGTTSNNRDYKEFLVSYQLGDTARVSGFETSLPAQFQSFRLIHDGKLPLLALDYAEHDQSSMGNTELEVTALLAIDGFAVPLARVVRKLWRNSQGNYDPACEDFQYYSIDFSRGLSVKHGRISIGEGVYKYSSNINCEQSKLKQMLAGGHYEVRDYLLIRQQ